MHKITLPTLAAILLLPAATATHVSGTAHYPPDGIQTELDAAWDSLGFTGVTVTTGAFSGTTLEANLTYITKTRGGGSCGGAVQWIRTGVVGSPQGGPSKVILPINYAIGNDTAYLFTDGEPGPVFPWGVKSFTYTSSTNFTMELWLKPDVQMTLSRAQESAADGGGGTSCTATVSTTYYTARNAGDTACADTTNTAGAGIRNSIDINCFIISTPYTTPNPPLFARDGQITGNLSSLSQALFGTPHAYDATLFWVGLLLIIAIAGGIASVTGMWGGIMGGFVGVLFVGFINWWPVWLVVLTLVGIGGLSFLLAGRGNQA